MRTGYNIEVVETNSVPMIAEKKATRFFDHTMEEDPIDNEFLKNAKKQDKKKINFSEI